ncbi:PAS domain S-box protein [Horticoccus luteus]|uniref:histidine kinase n=1 Tax=Horticoccus luteus TaxID=2862869 RepID=A0A8F9XGH6_9BACT|nr:PAS domain-containing sensor histidine kinase [Horticoccus luteus]QYM79222.1 PAS domain S-box protein [Horticoccus luteus]
MDAPSQQLTLEQRFNLFLETACDYAIFFMAADGTITEWSAGAEKIFGYSESAAVGLNGRIIFTPGDIERGVPEQEMARAIREGQANDERWHVRQDGSRLFATGRMVALKDHAGRISGFAKIVRDATPYKTLEQALHASDAQFRATFAQAPIGMVLSDLHGRIQQVNATFCAMTGYAMEDLPGRELVSLTTPSDRDHVRAQIDQLLTGERTSVVVEKQMQRADHTLLWVQNSMALLRDAEGRPLSFIDLCQDISVLKLSAEELERLVAQRTTAVQEKTKQMEAFCYAIAHDLRAPLRAISSYSDILRLDFAPSLPPEAAGHIHRIAASADRLERLISDLLGYTRAQQGPLAFEDVDLTEVALLALERVRRESETQDLQFELLAPLGRVRADRAALDQVFFNLISNAVKFRCTDVSLHLRIFAETKAGRRRVWFEDNGIGVDPQSRHRAFGMFERLHPKLKIPGMGMGLAIVATAMTRLGGSYGIEDNEPAGSRFWIEFPA